MASRTEIANRLTQPGVIPVIRTQTPEAVLPLAEALLAGGLNALEITMTVPNAVAIIRAAAGAFGGRALVGAGTVLDAATARAVIEAGAQFVVSPLLRPELVAVAHAADRVVMLGAYTPTEAQTAHEAGADFVKIFPADTLGPGYIKALRGPLPHLRLVPTGGVDLTTIGAFFQAGVAAVGVGSSLVSPQIVRAADWTGLTRLAADYVQAAQAARRA